MDDKVSILGGAASIGRIADERSILMPCHTTTQLLSATGAKGHRARRLPDRRCLRISRIFLEEAPWNHPFKRGDHLCPVDRLRAGGREEHIVGRARTMLLMMRLLETRGGDIHLERTMKHPSRTTPKLKSLEKGEATWTRTHPPLPISLCSSTTLYLVARLGSTWASILNRWIPLLQDPQAGKRFTSQMKT